MSDLVIGKQGGIPESYLNHVGKGGFFLAVSPFRGMKGWENFFLTFAFQNHRSQVKFNMVRMQVNLSTDSISG